MPHPLSADTPGQVSLPTLTDYLSVDPAIPGQVYVLLSVVSPTSNQKCDRIAVKIRGVCATQEEADARVKLLQRMDPHYDILCAPMGQWLLMPPDLDRIQDQRYQDEYLENMMKTYNENQQLAKQHFEERKRSVMEEGLLKNLLPHERQVILNDDDEAAGSSGAEAAGSSA